MKSLLLIIAVVIAGISTAAEPAPRPDPREAAAFARWLVSESSWGVLTTVDYRRRNAPFGNVVSFADNGTGVPYFYLSVLDPTAPNAMMNPLASFTLTEEVLGTCTADPQSPSCAKLTLSGELELLPRNSSAAAFGERALFQKHPSFQGFPKLNGSFFVFQLAIDEIFLVNLFGPPRNLSVIEYLSI